MKISCALAFDLLSVAREMFANMIFAYGLKNVAHEYWKYSVLPFSCWLFIVHWVLFAARASDIVISPPVQQLLWNAISLIICESLSSNDPFIHLSTLFYLRLNLETEIMINGDLKMHFQTGWVIAKAIKFIFPQNHNFKASQRECASCEIFESFCREFFEDLQSTSNIFFQFQEISYLCPFVPLFLYLHWF